MKNVFKLSSLLLVAVLFVASCSEDDPDPVDNTPDPTGSWRLQSATLVDPNPLQVKNFTTDGVNFIDLTLPAGAATVAEVTQLVGGALAGTVCVNPANYATFYLELTSSNDLVFHCPDASPAASENSGNWVVIETNGTYSVTLNVTVGDGAAATTIPITVNDFEISADGSTFSGQASGYPMVKDLAFSIGEDLNQGAGTPDLNIQFLTTDMVFTAVQ